MDMKFAVSRTPGKVERLEWYAYSRSCLIRLVSVVDIATRNTYIP